MNALFDLMALMALFGVIDMARSIVRACRKAPRVIRYAEEIQQSNVKQLPSRVTIR